MFLEVAIRQAFLLALAVGFDQAHFVRKLVQRILQRLANGLIFERSSIIGGLNPLSQVLKSLTPDFVVGSSMPK